MHVEQVTGEAKRICHYRTRTPGFAQYSASFSKCKYAKPVALVSGDPEKASAVGACYGIPGSAIITYAYFERLQDNPEADAVYIMLPMQCMKNLR